MPLPSDKFFRYLQLTLFGLALFFLLKAFAIPIKGLLDLKKHPQPVVEQKVPPQKQPNIIRLSFNTSRKGNPL